MHRKVSWAVVGLGRQGNRLVEAMRSSSHAELVATASEREEGSFASALENKQVDALAIATPNDQHAAQVIAAARAGKHILCEKPLALSLHEGRAIEQAVKKNNVKCFVNYHLRMHPEAQKAKKLIAQKKFGDITYIEMQWSIGDLSQKKLPTLPPHMRWREDPKQAGGGTLPTRGVHLFDLLRFLTGKEVVGVRGWSDATKTQVDRTMVGIFILEGNIPTIITTSKVMPHADNRIAIYGTKGQVILRDIFKDDPQALYTKVFDAFADAIKGKKTPLATLDDGIAAIAMAEKFNRVAQKFIA